VASLTLRTIILIAAVHVRFNFTRIRSTTMTTAAITIIMVHMITVLIIMVLMVLTSIIMVSSFITTTKHLRSEHKLPRLILTMTVPLAGTWRTHFCQSSSMPQRLNANK